MPFKLSLVLITIGLVVAAYIQFYSNSLTIPKLSPEQTKLIGKKIWQNEGAGKIENLTVWNKHEDFPSLGIGHFIWFPSGVNPPFEESFPQLLAFIKENQQIPAWLNATPDAPWNSREIFYQQFDSPQLQELRKLMQNTIHLQTEFIIRRMDAALPKILNTLPDKASKRRVEEQFYRVADSARQRSARRPATRSAWRTGCRVSTANTRRRRRSASRGRG